MYWDTSMRRWSRSFRFSQQAAQASAELGPKNRISRQFPTFIDMTNILCNQLWGTCAIQMGGTPISNDPKRNKLMHIHSKRYKTAPPRHYHFPGKIMYTYIHEIPSKSTSKSSLCQGDFRSSFIAIPYKPQQAEHVLSPILTGGTGHTATTRRRSDQTSR